MRHKSSSSTFMMLFILLLILSVAVISAPSYVSAQSTVLALLPGASSSTLSGTEQVINVDSYGNFYMLDLTGKEVVLIRPSDGLIFASYDPSLSFVTPIGMCVDPNNNNIYVTDASASDEKLWFINVTSAATSSFSVASTYVTSTRNCRVDTAGYIYVCSPGTSTTTAGKIYKFASNGTLLLTITSGTYITWCMDLAIDPLTGNIWQTNYYGSSLSHQLSGFTPTGTLIWSGNLAGITNPQSVVQDPVTGLLWIGDASSNTIVSFNTTSLSIVNTIHTTNSAGVTYNAAVLAWNRVTQQLHALQGNNIITVSQTTGAALATLTPKIPIKPNGIAIDYTNTVYVSDSNHASVVSITLSTQSNLTYNGPLASPYSYSNSYSLIATPFYSTNLTTPGCLAVDLLNNLYICDTPSTYAGRIFIVNKQATLIKSLSFTPYALYSPQQIAVDSQQNIYVLDYASTYQNALLVYSQQQQQTLSITATSIYGLAFNPQVGNILLATRTSATSTITTYTAVSANLRLQSVVASIPIMSSQFSVDVNGNFYVTDSSHTAISVYNSAGQFITSINSTNPYLTIPSTVINQGAVAVDTAGNVWTMSTASYTQLVLLQGLGYNGKGQTREIHIDIDIDIDIDIHSMTGTDTETEISVISYE